jgi:hypothetical protein
LIEDAKNIKEIENKIEKEKENKKLKEWILCQTDQKDYLFYKHF